MKRTAAAATSASASARKSDSSDEEYSSKPKQSKSSKFLGNIPPWKHGLLQSMNDTNLIVFKDDQVVVIKDKYPKAKYHFLVLPHQDLSNLTKVTKDDLALLKHMDMVGRSIVEKHKDVEFRFGYHAVPSMSRLHLHVISQDFDSPCLKTKKHWNSFTTKFFIDSEDIIKELQEYGKVTNMDSKTAEAFLKSDLKCHRCSMTFSTIPKLKDHLTKCNARKGKS